MNSDLDIAGILTALGVVSLLFAVPVVVFLHDAARAARSQADEPEEGGRGDDS